MQAFDEVREEFRALGEDVDSCRVIWVVSEADLSLECCQTGIVLPAPPIADVVATRQHEEEYTDRAMLQRQLMITDFEMQEDIGEGIHDDCEEAMAPQEDMPPLCDDAVPPVPPSPFAPHVRRRRSTQTRTFFLRI